MINTCCNLYFYYNFIVHGGIRHLEILRVVICPASQVHGGIRHLESMGSHCDPTPDVHGGIRHLEINLSVAKS